MPNSKEIKTVPGGTEAVHNAKVLLRKEMIARRKNIPPAERARADEAICRHLLTCLETYPLEAVAITGGKEFAVIGTRQQITRIAVPQIENAINPIGAGDTCSAVFFSEYISGTAPEEAFACGLCAATASCMTDTPAMYDKNIALSLRKEIEFTGLKG